jgi:invasion protein IalB
MLKRVWFKCFWGSLTLLALGTSLALAQEGQPVPKTKTPAAHPSSPVAAGMAQADESPWTKLCTKNDQTDNRQICLVQHGGIDPETGIVLGTVAVRSVEGEDRQALVVGLTTAYSLVIPVGVQIKIDDSEQISLQYVFCFSSSCQAQIELTKENLDKMRKGKQMILSAMTMQQRSMGFPVPLPGFGNAYDGPPADNAKFEEAWRQLMEKSRQRQIELANKIAAQQKEQSTQQLQAGAPPQVGVQVPAQPPSH